MSEIKAINKIEKQVSTLSESNCVSTLSNSKSVSTLTVDDLAQICAEEGVTVREVMKVLADGMKSNTVGKLDNEGEIIFNSVQPDMVTRHKYMVSAMEMFKIIGKNEVRVSGVIEHKMLPKEDVERIEAVFKEEVELRKMLSSKGYSTNASEDVVDVTYTAIREQ